MKSSKLLLSISVGFIGLANVSCDRKPNTNTLFNVAKEAMLLTCDNPNSLNILGYSKVDSVFGKCFLTENELMVISQKVMDFTDKLYSSDDIKNLSEAQLSRMMSLSSIAEPFMNNELDTETKGPFSGWKIKLEYEQPDGDGDVYHGERYFIFDKSANHILHSIDVPI